MTSFDLLNNKTLVLWIMAFVVGNLNHSTIHWLRTDPDREQAINWIKWFAPKNESIWEHVKMAYFPLIFLTLLFQPEADLPVRIMALSFHLLVMISLYYTVVYFYTCKDQLSHSIIIFIISLAAGYMAEGWLLGSSLDSRVIMILAVIITLAIVLLSYIQHQATPDPDGSWNLDITVPDQPFILYDMFEDKNQTGRFLCRCGDPYRERER